MSAQQRESGSWWMLTSQLTKELSGLQWLHTAYYSAEALRQIFKMLAPLLKLTYVGLEFSSIHQ